MEEIIVIDDMKTNTMVLELLLNEIGYRNVVTFNTAVDALAYLDDEKSKENNNKEIVMIFLDLMMPNMSGINACQAIRIEESYMDTPIIITTGRQVTKHEVNKFGATDCLIKPIAIEDIQLMTAQYIK